MIVSHRHRFIFLKTAKTGGTSVELALSELCGPEDVITPVSRPDERLRRGAKPQNYLLPIRERPLDWPLRLLFRRANHVDDEMMRFWPHMRAEVIRTRLGAEIFDAYRKVTVERNPWDREVSRYFWRFRDASEKPSFRDFVLTEIGGRPSSNFSIYSIGGRIVADTVLHHDRLGEDFAAFVKGLGVATVPVLPSAKTTSRPRDARAYRTMYDAETRGAIAARYAREIAAFGFEF